MGEFKEKALSIVYESWHEVEIIINANVNDLCSQKRHSDAEDLETCRDCIKAVLIMNGYKVD